MLVLSRNKGGKGGAAGTPGRTKESMNARVARAKSGVLADNGTAGDGLTVEVVSPGDVSGVPASPLPAWNEPPARPGKKVKVVEKTYAEKLADCKGKWELFKVHYEEKAAKPMLALTSLHLFQNFITTVIMIAALLVGIQTYKSMEDNDTLATLDNIVLYIFTAEVVLKIIANGTRWWRYFGDSWNRFDFLVVFVCYLPLDASMVTVLRLFRLLRVLKLVKALPELQVLVQGLLSSLSSIVYVALLLMLVFYLYGVLCVSLFRDNDPVHFGSLETTFLTLFRMATFEDWTDVMYTQMFGCEVYPYHFREHWCTNPQPQGWYPAPFFISFVVLSSFVVLNLFIGVITSNMQEARDAQKEDQKATEEVDSGKNLALAIAAAQQMLDEVAECYKAMQENLDKVNADLAKAKKPPRPSFSLGLSRSGSKEDLSSPGGGGGDTAEGIPAGSPPRGVSPGGSILPNRSSAVAPATDFNAE